MRSPTRAEIICRIQEEAVLNQTRLYPGRIRPIYSLANLARIFDGFRQIHVSEHHSEVAACDWLTARGIYPAGRHRLITIAISKDDMRRASITHLPDGTVRVRVYSRPAKKG